MEKNAIESLDQLMDGAVTERYESAMKQVIENILDLNTDAKKERKITLTVSIKPNERRDIANFKVEAKTTLAPRVPVETTLMFGVENGEVIAREHNPKIVPGQIDMDGQEHGKITPLTSIK